MPANTPKGLPYPLPTEPLANGADAIKNLATAVDTYLNRHSCKAKQVAVQSIPAATSTLVVLDGEDWDTDAYHDLVTLNTRIVVPAGLGGLYIVSGATVFPNPSEAGNWNALIRKNGATYLALGAGGSVTIDANRLYSGVAVQDVAVPGDYYELFAYQAHNPSGGAANLVAAHMVVTRLSA